MSTSAPNEFNWPKTGIAYYRKSRQSALVSDYVVHCVIVYCLGWRLLQQMMAILFSPDANVADVIALLPMLLLLLPPVLLLPLLLMLLFLFFLLLILLLLPSYFRCC